MISGFPDKPACRGSGSRRSRLLRERYDQMEPHRVPGQDKAVFHAGAGLRLVGELIVACHDQQTSKRSRGCSSATCSGVMLWTAVRSSSRVVRKSSKRNGQL